MSVTIKIVNTKGDLKAFVKFPLKLYKGCPFYVPGLYMDEMATLNPATNPMSKYAKSRLFLAYKDGKLVGRVAAIINEIANKNWQHQEVRFGWIDFIDDMEVSKALIEAVSNWGRKMGMTQVTGPLGFTDFDNEGCVVEGFDQISTYALRYNYEYYGKHFQALSMTKANDWLEYRIYVPDALPEKVTRIANIVRERYGLHIKKLTKRDVTKGGYGQKLFDLVNRTYFSLYDFTVLPQDVMDKYVESYLGLLDMDYVTVIEDSQDKLVALAVAMPSIARAVQKGRGYLFPLGWWHLLKAMYLKHDKAIELMLIGVDPEYRNRGVHAMLFNQFIGNLIKGGFKYGESNAEMESNTSVQNIWNDYQKDFIRRRRVFTKEI
ncbi:MAG: N-acetyltransferase [Spirochaetia bacterium]|nr:N-acetyltransferase [Spirochaetia bacterium]